MARKKVDEDDLFNNVLLDANKEFDLETVVPEKIQSITTGNIAIDHILGVGGLPLGRNIELFGDPSSGKSTVALQAAAALQQKIIREGLDEYIVYYDYENTVDTNYGVSLGLKCKSLEEDPENYHKSWKLFQPNTLEQGTNHARKLIETGRVRLIIWDSVAEMTPASFFDDETGKATMAVRARLMSQFLQQTSAPLRTHKCSQIFLNHSMVDIQTGGYRPASAGVKKTTPGGKALKFHASVRVEFSQIKSTKTKQFNPITNTHEEVTSSTDVKVKVVKNKVADPFRECTVRVRYGKGFDNFWTAMQILQAHKSLPSQQGGYYYFEKLPHLVHDDMDTSQTGRRGIRGEANLMEFADSHPEWRELVIQEASQVITQAQHSTLNVESDEDEGTYSLGMSSLLDDEE